MKMSVIGTNQKILVICVKWSDVTTTRMASRDWINLLTSQVNTFYNQASFNKTNFTFELPPSQPGGPADGWFSLGYAVSNYNYHRTGQDAINLVDPFVDFAQYNGVLLITNNSGFGGQTNSGDWWKTTRGSEQVFIENGSAVPKRQMGLSMINEWHPHDYGMSYDEAAAVAVHEIGHQLDLQTHYADLRWSPSMNRDSITRWDVMGLSPYQQHFLGWAKADRQWFEAGRIRTVGPPVGSNIDITISLAPQEQDINAVQLIKIPILTSPFIGYVIENRQRINGDEGLPSAGVLVSLVDENPMVVYGLKDIVMDNEPSPGQLLDGAALGVAGSFFDSERNININVVSMMSNNYNVRIQYPLPPPSRPNLMITPWGAPPYSTPDIWLDNERNGWNVYRYTDGAGNPTGQGDDAWVNHDNRVYVRVHNLGPGLATDVRVQVYVNSPPGMGDAGPDWVNIGTILFPTIAAGLAVQDFVLWRPTVTAHTCIRAEIEQVPGEVGTANHRAQENVAMFDTASGSPWKPVSLKMRVYNPHKKNETPVSFNTRDIPKGWAVEINPTELMLPAGGYGWVEFGIYPSGSPGDAGSERGQYEPGFLGRPKIEAFVPYADTFIPIGGIDVWAHLVEVTELTLVHNPMAISGQLKPGFPNATVAVEITSKQQRLLHYIKTDKNGNFNLQSKEVLTGWNIQAFFDGDDTHGATESDLINVVEG
jgi:M6 family metalloprotease-like protein